MYTRCTTEDCQQKYKIQANMIGSNGRCKKCDTVFVIEEHIAQPKVIEFEFEDEPHEEKQTDNGPKRKKTSKEVMAEHIENIRQEVNAFIPRLNVSLEKKENESDTRLLITKMLQRVLSYNLEDIKTEQKISGRRADYVLSINDEDVMVIEAKKIGMALREGQIFQATSYGAHSGIKWALLTNAVVWDLYHVSTGDKIETDLVFSIDLRDGLDDEEAHFFYLISKPGMSRKGLLDSLWKKISALCYDNIVNAILTDGVISKIRTTLTKETGCKLTNDELRNAIDENIFQLE